MKLKDDLLAVKAAYEAGDYLTAADKAFDAGKDAVALVRMFTGGGLLKGAGDPSTTELAECAALCDEMSQHHTMASAGNPAGSSPIWGKVFAIVDAVFAAIKELIGGA